MRMEVKRRRIKDKGLLTFNDKCNINHVGALGVDSFACIDTGIISIQFCYIQNGSLRDNSLYACTQEIQLDNNFSCVCVYLPFFGTIGKPSFVHVYWISAGLPIATNGISSNSPSIPTDVVDGGGLNFGGTV